MTTPCAPPDPWAAFLDLFCADDVYSQLADDSPAFSSEDAMAERARICAPENRPRRENTP